MKPNHNQLHILRDTEDVVYTMSKIQNETKSQLYTYLQTGDLRCLYYVKDTK